MQREIRFRCYHLGCKQIVSIDFKAKHVLLYDQYGWTSFETIELMQYTGLSDKNAVIIYEGDILKHPRATAPEELGFIIKFVKYRFVAININYPNDVVYNATFNEYFNECEVIGNVFENPELIK